MLRASSSHRGLRPCLRCVVLLGMAAHGVVSLSAETDSYEDIDLIDTKSDYCGSAQGRTRRTTHTVHLSFH